MTENVLRDYYGKILGYIQEESNGDKKLLDYYRKTLGTYSKKQNVTRDYYGKIIGRGDVLTMLLKK